MDSPIRKQQKRNDYLKHKMFRKIKRRRKAEQEQAINAPAKELRRRLRRRTFKCGKDAYSDGKDEFPKIINLVDREKQNVQQWGNDWKERIEMQDVKVPLNPVYKQNRFKDKQGNWHHTKKQAQQADKESEFKRALYNNVDPTGEIPNWYEAPGLYLKVKRNQYKDPDKYNRRPLENFADSVADAAWRKYLGYTYDERLLPTFNGDTVSLPKQLEQEIPVDTNMLKQRIANNEALYRRYENRNNDYLKMALRSDRRALESLRKTYATGLPTGFDEFSFNSRNWLDKYGVVNPPEGTPPLNVMLNYNQRYDKDTNRMYYSDTWDLDGYDNFLGGTPFKIRGYVDLPTYRNGKDSGIHIKPENRGKFTRLKKRTGKSASWFKAHGTPAQKKMAVFALNSRKWSHKK